MSDIGIGVIGAGQVAQYHLEALAKTPEARVIALYDVVPHIASQTAAAYDVPYVEPTLEDLLDHPEIDAVIVATPPVVHREHTTMALAAGKHVLCEKPFALNASEAESMVKAADEHGHFLAVCSGRERFGAGPATAHLLVRSGDLGDVYHVRSCGYRLRGRPISDNPNAGPWFVDRSQAGGGALIDIGVYHLDQVLWLMGFPRVTDVLCTTYDSVGAPVSSPLGQAVEDHAVVMFSCENGASAIVEVAWRSNIVGQDRAIILGTKAGLRFNPLSRVIAGADRQAVEDRLLDVPDDYGTRFGDITTRFVRSVLRGEQPDTSGEEALEVTRLIDAAYRSASIGQAVTLSR